MDKKRFVRSLFAGLIFLGAIAGYFFCYQLPAVRFAHRILPLIYRTETVSVYQKDTCKICITERKEEAEIQFLSAGGSNQVFFVRQTGYEVSAFDSAHRKLVSGIWGGGYLRSTDGQKMPEYTDMKSRLKSEHFAPDAYAAIYIYKAYPTASRGGKRAPLLIFMAVILWLTFLYRLDAGPVCEPNLRYTLPMLNDYGKETKSAQTREGERIVFTSAVILGIVCVGILLYDILCF